MSLINDALKKAQKQRTGDVPSLASMPSVGGETPHRIARRAKPAGFDTLILRAGIGAGVVLVLAIGAWLALREKPDGGLAQMAQQTGNLKAEDSNPQTAAQPASPVVQNPAPGSALPAQNPQVSTPAQPAFTLPVAQVPAPSQQPPTQATAAGFSASVSQSENRGQTPGGQQPATASPQVSVPSPAPAPTGSSLQVSPFSPVGKPRDESLVALAKGDSSQPSVSAVPPPKLEPRAIQFIENIKVGAIMARTTADAKVLMNDRVYRVGSLVEAEMGLTLVEITTGSLTFEDERGGRYTRTF